jgi:hypothetical protein
VALVLFISVFLISACGLIYELVAGTLASYLVGDSVFQFSTIIGCYLFAMGIGSALSRYIHRGLVHRFIWIELMIGLIGGFSSALLFLAFAYTQAFAFLMYFVVTVIGVLVGLEIPLLMRIVRGHFDFRDAVAHVLTFDYIGALAVSYRPGAAAGPGAVGHAVRHRQCRRGAMEHLSVRGAVGSAAVVARSVRHRAGDSARRHAGSKTDHRLRRR